MNMPVPLAHHNSDNRSGEQPVQERFDTPSLSYWLALVAICLLALLFRFHHLADMPPGLHYDEAFNGLDAYALLETPLADWPIFFTGNFGREPLFIYLLAAAEALFGPSNLTLRLLPALIGFLLTPGLAWLAWELAPSLGIKNRERFSLWSGLAILTLLWSQIFARYAIRAGLFTLIEILLWASLWRAWRSNALRWWALTGVLAGISFYTYLPARLLPLVLVPMLALALWRYRQQLRQRWKGMVLGLGIATFVAAPLGIYFLRNPLSFSTRTEQVLVAGQDSASVIKQHILATLGMAFIEGDANIRNNIPGRPVLDFLMLAPFLIGFANLVRHLLRPASLFLLSWLGVMLLPTILSDYAPAFHRAIGAMPVFALLIALALDKVVSWVGSRWPSVQRWGVALAWMALFFAVVLTWQSFTVWSASPGLFYARDVGFQQLATLLEDMPQQRMYVSPRGSEHPTVRYLRLTNEASNDLHGFDGRICVSVPNDVAAKTIFLSQEDFRGPKLVSSYLPDSTIAPLIQDFEGKEWAIILHKPAGSTVEFPEMNAYPVVLSDGIQLHGYWLSQPTLQPGERLYVRLFWQVMQNPSQDYTTFVQLVQPTTDGGVERLGGVDAPPGGGSCTTSDWLPVEIVVDELQFILPDDLDPSLDTYLAVGFYSPDDNQRLSIPQNPDDQILIGPLTTTDNN